jgi:hypothetical protein
LHHLPPASLAAVVSAEDQPAYTSTETGFAPPRAWFKSPAAIFAFVAVGLIAAMMLTSIIVIAIARPKNRPVFSGYQPAGAQPPVAPHPTFAQPPQNPAGTPQPTPTPIPPTAPTTQTGQYAVGSAVEANWAGGWIPGKITRVNPGGFSVMVQLADARSPHPIVLSINQIRLK